MIRKLAGFSQILPHRRSATLDCEFPKSSGLRRLLRGKVYWQGEELKVTLTGKQNPGVLKSLLGCNALVDVPAGSGALRANQQVQIILLEQ